MRRFGLSISVGAWLLTPVATLHPQDAGPVRRELASSRTATMDLETGWDAPPRIARTRVWWWWLNGNVTRDAITRDLEEMRAKGIGGANIIDAGGADQRGNRPVPHGPDFASPEWQELFAHALREADRLDLELGFNIQSGWNLGGPGVTPQEAAKKLTWSEAVVEGGREVSTRLPRPASREGFYRDVATVAFPLPSPPPDAPAWRVAASSAQREHPAKRSADGDAATFWVSGSADPGRGPTPERPEWLELRCDRSVRVDGAVVEGRPRYGPRRGRLEVWREGGRRETLAEFSLGAEERKTLAFRPVRGDRFRLVLLAAWDPRFPGSPRNVQVAEWTLTSGGRTLTSLPTDVARIAGFEAKAYHRYPGGFTATEAWHLLDAGPERPAEPVCRLGEVRNLSDRVGSDGTLRWDAPAGSWRVLRIGYTLAGSRVSTHSEGWAGRAIDYLDPAAFDAYWERVMVPILRRVAPSVGRSLRFLHTDSWELGPVNWTPALPERFRTLRGYDLMPYLPAICGYVVESREISTRFLNDFRRTLADLIAAGKYATFSRRARERGLGIHPESGGPHAAPIDALLNLGISDVPMGEFWARSRTHRVEDGQRLFVKQPASAAHVYGRRLVLAEAFTTIGPQWERAPRDLKPVFDRVACEGLNLTMLHTFDCSPAGMGIPGQAYFAGTHINPQVTWWHRAGAFIGYLNRCHFLLQQGLPVADVLYFYGENVPGFVRLQRDDPSGALPGYDYDVTCADALLTRVRVDPEGGRGALLLPDGVRYRLLALPAHDAIRTVTLERIAELVEAGATVVGRRPRRPLGLAGGARAQARFRSLVDRLWGAEPGDVAAEDGSEEGSDAEKTVDASTRRVGRGRVICGRTAREVLMADGIGPDVALATGAEDARIDHLHRSTDRAEIYFLVNRRDRVERVHVSLRVAGLRPELWDPLTGGRKPAPTFRQEDGRTVVPIRLSPHGSIFVILRERIRPDVAVWPPRPEPAPLAHVPVPGPWEVRFDPRWGGPESVRFPELVDWTKRPEEGIRHYSGTATYEIRVARPSAASAAGNRVVLDLGEVQSIATVRIDGREIGTLWTPPFRLDVTDVLRGPGHRLEVEVVNLWPNRLIGDQRLPVERRRTRTNITKFRSDTPLRPSGLLGPVTLEVEESRGP